MKIKRLMAGPFMVQSVRQTWTSVAQCRGQRHDGCGKRRQLQAAARSAVIT
ncbi:MAG: hypothetical protein ACLUDF_07030 [Butyricicoccus sp.]